MGFISLLNYHIPHGTTKPKNKPSNKKIDFDLFQVLEQKCAVSSLSLLSSFTNLLFLKIWFAKLDCSVSDRPHTGRQLSFANHVLPLNSSVIELSAILDTKAHQWNVKDSSDVIVIKTLYTLYTRSPFRRPCHISMSAAPLVIFVNVCCIISSVIYQGYISFILKTLPFPSLNVPI